MDIEPLSYNKSIMDRLSEPFHPSRVGWRAKAVAQTKDKALAEPHVDVRAYQNRLDEACGLGWGVSYMPWDDRIICVRRMA